MAKAQKPKELFTASEVANFCQVDLKTIHNWADRGEIPHFRTPGRHLRFRSADVLGFLRKFGYPIPGPLRGGRPRVVVLDDDAGTLSAAERTLSGSFEVTTSREPFDALIAMGAEAPDALVLGMTVGGIDCSRVLGGLMGHQATKHVRAVVLSDKPVINGEPMPEGASAVLPRPDMRRLAETLVSLMGLDR